MELRPSSSCSISHEMGLPRTRNIARPASTDANSGMTRTGIRPRAQVGTFQLAIQCAAMPARAPPIIAPMKPVAG
jgi:hypothetical protein